MVAERFIHTHPSLELELVERRLRQAPRAPVTVPSSATTVECDGLGFSILVQ